MVGKLAMEVQSLHLSGVERLQARRWIFRVVDASGYSVSWIPMDMGFVERQRSHK